MTQSHHQSAVKIW